MRKLFEVFRSELERFLDQRQNGVLLLSMPGEQVAYSLSTLKAIGDSGTCDVILFFPHAFEKAASYVSIIAGRVKASYEAAREELKLADPPPGLGRFPETSLDEERPAIDRLREALTFSRNLVHKDGGGRLVCALTPMEIHDPHDYAKLAAGIVNTAGGHPWFAGIRIILREDSEHPMLEPALASHPFVATLAVDFSNEAMVRSLEEEASGQEEPVEQRAQSLVQLAFNDYSNQRYDWAVARFEDALAYYQGTNNFLLQSLILTGLGDVYNRAGHSDLAQDWYERALVPAAETGAPVMLFTIGRNLGHLHYARGDFQEAEIYFDGAQKLALETKDPECKILSLEWRGLSQQGRGALDQAADSYEEAARLAGEFRRMEHRDRNINHLHEVALLLGQGQRLASVKRELTATG
jgi:Tfp pilus assembly protein PilF